FFLRVISFPVNEKTALAGGFSKVKRVGALLTEVTGLEELSHQNLFFQFSLNRCMTSRFTPP
ncbi:hypothetical protein ACXU4J_23100, partial [Escherichia coli]